jgi:hypothetical protein
MHKATHFVVLGHILWRLSMFVSGDITYAGVIEQIKQIIRVIREVMLKVSNP